MTIQDLLNWCNENGVPLDTHMVVSRKDEFLVVPENLRLDTGPYFGNCDHGDVLLDEIAPADDETCERTADPKFLFIGTGY